MRRLALFLVAASAWGQTTINGDRSVLGKLDLSTSQGFMPPAVATDPSGSCTILGVGKPNVVISIASGNLFTCLGGTWHVSSGVNGQSPNLRGAWSAATTYNVLDVVTYAGGAWWAIAANTAVTPGTDSTKWTEIALPGSSGPAGPQGPAGSIGPQGPAGNQGPQGLTGPQGVSGQALNARGVWSATTAYNPLDTVSYNGNTYVAVVATTNVVPGTDNTKWNLIGATGGLANIQNGGATLPTQAALNFASPIGAANNAGQSRIDVTCASCEVNTNRGAANGYTPLDSGAHVPAANLPTIAVANGGTGSNSSTGWQSILQYQGTAAGSVTRTAGAKLAERMSVLDFGAVCNGVADDTNAVNAAINAANLIGGVNLYLPPSVCMVSSPINLLRGVRIIGADMASSTIRATSNFPQNSAVVNIGDPAQASTALHYASLQDLTVDANNVAGSTCIYSNRMQEGSYIETVALSNYTLYGINLVSYGIQNSYVRNIFAAASTQSTTAIGIHLSQAQSRMALEKLTIYAVSLQSTPAIFLENSSNAQIRDFHCEQYTVCVKVDSGSSATVENMWGHPSDLTLVQFTPTAIGGAVSNLTVTGAATNIGIDDQLHGYQTTGGSDAYLQEYATDPNSVLTTSNVVPNVFGAMTATNLTSSYLKLNTGGYVQTATTGMVIQGSNASTPGFLGGGLQLIGNGYSGDPSWGGVSAGVTSDLGTFTARAPSANVIQMGNGVMRLSADTGLTAGSPYTPTTQATIAAQGLQLTPKPADPGCTSNSNVGRLWVNTAAVPTLFQTCGATGSGFGWSTPVTSVQNAGSSITSRPALNFAAPLTAADNAASSRSDVSLPAAGSAQSGYLASSDWNSFNGKASAGACPANAFVTTDNATGGPTCVQPSFTNVAGAATKAQQVATTTYTDQDNTVTAGTQDWTNAAHTKPVKSGPLASMPVSCVAGEYYYATDQQREAFKQCGSGGTFQNSSGVVSNGLIADYWMSNCDGSIGSGTTVPDCSGSGNSMTLPGGGNPSWSSLGLTWTTSSTSAITLPTNILNNFVTVQIYADMSLANNYTNTAQIQTFLSAGTTSVFWGNVTNTTPLCCGLYSGWKGSPTQTIDPAIGPNLFTESLSSTNDILCIGANCNPSYYTRAGNLPTTRTGPLLLGGNTQTGQMTGTMYRVLFYNRALSAAEVAQNDSAVDSWVKYRGVSRGKYTPSTAVNTLTCIGDSITQGKGATAACTSGSLLGLNDTFQIYNMGMSTELLANMAAAEAKFATGLNPNARLNVAWIFAGTNDMCVATNALTPQQTFQKLAGLSRYMRAQGAKVLVLPMLSRTGSFQSTTCDALHDTYNNLLAENWASFADGFLYSLLNDANLVADGAYANTTYFQSDGIHPTTAGQNLIAGYVQAEVNAMLTGSLNIGAYREAITTKSANYTAQLGDNVILCNATSAAVTITLPTAIGIQGRVFQMKKTDASANACKLQPFGTQTIDGVTSVSITTRYATSKIESDNANWQVIQ